MGTTTLLAAIAAAIFGWATPAPAYVAPVAIVGDDNRDGIIDEDESGWNCATMGNQICGEPVDETVCYWDGHTWRSQYTESTFCEF